MEAIPSKFSTPEEELEFLRNRIAERERELLERSNEADSIDIETVGKEEIKDYTDFTPKVILHPEYELQGEDLANSVESISTSHDPVEELIQLAQEKGVRNALSVLDKTDNAYVIDEVHRRLIEHIKSGVEMSDLKEGVPPWHVLHMTLYELIFPAHAGEAGEERSIVELVGTMEQLFLGLRTIGDEKKGNHFAIEIAVTNTAEHIAFYISVPNEHKGLFEKQTLALFPYAVLTEQVHDYNIYADGGHTLIADLKLKKHPVYPLKTYHDFSSDPLAVIINTFSKIEKEGCGAALQFIIRHPKKRYHSKYEDIIKDLEKGDSASEAVSKSTLAGGAMHFVGDLFSTATKKPGEVEKPLDIDTEAIELFKKKIETPIVEVNVRIAVSSTELPRAEQILSELKSSFDQLDSVAGNKIWFIEQKGIHLRHAQRAFSFRQLSQKTLLPLSLSELATFMHFPNEGELETPQMKQSYSKEAPAPSAMPEEGTLLGVNKFRGSEKEIFSTEKDRMRHFYIIGQTGTGKSIFLQNLIVQDIQAGAGVCMIDPHGTDIEEILGTIPPEREKDVIYFDPSRMDRAVGLNMLEYDYSKPEQKTFVVNELFSIFQKLYGGNPESMGPMFEQYFRNATMLVMEDPESGNTLMDIGRVMVDAKYRRHKLERATNPTVVQFWREIATKAGGEASLENIVPYIVSKFDVFTANDYIRPIIGQQTSSFNFREIMDEKKILLVNLSKGRLGEINANLIGMIIVGKILMAALSRVDDPTKSFPPFFLHIDEFQNVSTDSISSILSEARKYKLGLSVAHQFIAQLDPGIKDAVFGNVGSIVSFRVGPEDGQFLEQQFSPVFDAGDLMNIPNYHACMRVLADGSPTIPFSAATTPPPKSNPDQVARIIEMSSAIYGRPREEVEMEIQKRYQKPAPPVPRAPE
jgi:hypothetical protein